MEVEADEYTGKKVLYPVYINLKDQTCTKTKKPENITGKIFTSIQKNTIAISPVLSCTDILMNGIYWG